MRTRLTRFLFVLVTTASCTVAFASSLTDAGQDFVVQGPGGTGQAGAPAWFDVFGGSELMMPEPLLLAVEEGGREDNDKDGGEDSDKDGGEDNDKDGGEDSDKDGDEDNDKDGDEDNDNHGENEHGNDKVYVCHVLPNGKFITQKLPKKTALKLIEEHPHEWILGKCDDVISPS